MDITIIPNIADTDTHVIEQHIASVSGHAEWIHIDIADNTLVPTSTNLTYSFLKNYTSNLFEAHLMVAKPETYIKPLVYAGFSRLIAHIECHDPREFIAQAHTYDGEVGLAIDVDTNLEEIEPLLEELDMVLVMTAPAGEWGQSFDQGMLSKVKAIHRNLPDLPIEVEGGIDEASIKAAHEAGATRCVVEEVEQFAALAEEGR